MTAPTPPPADSRDARVVLADVIDRNVMGSGIMEDGRRSSWFNEGIDIVDAIEAAGLLVLLPDDATADRITRAIRLATQAGLIQPDSIARAILAALAERPSGGAG